MARAMVGLLAAGLSLGLLTGCGGEEEAEETGPDRPGGFIGISVLTMTNPFFKEIADAVTDEGRKDSYEVIVTSAEFDPAKQRMQVKDFLVRKVRAIILTPADSRAVGTAIKEANEAGVPVFTADIASLAEGAKVVSHIATDNYSGGRQAAKAIIQALEGKGKVAIIDHPEVESVILRTKGFRDELKESGSAIEIVGAWPGKGSKDEAFKVAQDILTAHQDLAGIFAINDPSALGACAAIEKENRAGKIVVVGFDGQPEGKRAIKEGRIFADPIQFPDEIGRRTVQTITKYLEGEKVPSEILIPTRLYYKADAEKDPALKAD